MIHANAYIEPGAVLGPDCVIHPFAVVTRHAVLGARVTVHPGAVVGGEPQHLAFNAATESRVRVGEGTIVREQVTINRAYHAGAETVVGARCLLMANSHVGHDCALGDDVVLANNVMLAGHVTVGAGSFIGGGAGIHQHARVGRRCMVSGLSRISRDLAPFTLTAERDEVIGLNVVGLRRAGVSAVSIRALKAAFAAVLADAGPGGLRAKAAAAAAALPAPEADGAADPWAEAREFLAFFAEGKRGFAGLRRTVGRASEGADDAG
jgi:UDP-N-acetylglucosamine acyltransferase